jgi:hypothetical protein
MPKRGYVGSSLASLKNMGDTLMAFKGGRVDVGFFAGDAGRKDESPKEAAARAARLARYTGAGEKPGFFKPGVEFAKRRAAVGRFSGEDQNLTNPELAQKHEFGIGVPRRSMLRMPLHLHGDKVLKDAKEDLRVQLQVVGRNPRAAARKLLARVGVAAENLVQEAFATRGFGSWKANAPATIALKGSDSPLIDTAQLRRAVASRAVL